MGTEGTGAEAKHGQSTSLYESLREVQEPASTHPLHPSPKLSTENMSENDLLRSVELHQEESWEQSEPFIRTISSPAQSQASTVQPKHARKRAVFSRLKSSLAFLDFSLFRRCSFRVFFVYCMLAPTVNVAVDYLPALAQQNQLSRAQAAQLLSVVGGVDLASRFLSGMLADLGVVPVPVMVGVALSVLGATYQCVRLMTSFPLLLVLAVMQGLLAGVVNCTVSLLALHVVGLQHMAKAIGFQILAEGAFLAAFHPLCGYIRDTTGSYESVYHVIGCALLLATTLLLTEELLRKKERGKRGCDSAVS